MNSRLRAAIDLGARMVSRLRSRATTVVGGPPAATPPPPGNPVTTPVSLPPITVNVPPQPTDFTQRLTAFTTFAAMLISGGAIYYSGQSAQAAKAAAEAGEKQAQANLRQAEAAQAAQLTERYATASEVLGSDSMDARIGAIFALERVMRDSPPDRSSVINLLSAFVRNHSLDNSPARLGKGKGGQVDAWRKPAFDVQEALKVLGRRDATRDEAPLDLSGSFLFGAKLDGLDMRNTLFTGADLGGVQARDTDFGGADLVGADLDGAELIGADFTAADLRTAVMDDAAVDGAILREADMGNASARRVIFEDADLTGLDLRSADLSYAVLTDSAILNGLLMDGTDLRGADLRDAGKLPEGALTCVTADQKTTRPPTGMTVDWAGSANCAEGVTAGPEPALDFRKGVTKRRAGP